MAVTPVADAMRETPTMFPWMNGSTRRFPAPVTVVPVPNTLTASICWTVSSPAMDALPLDVPLKAIETWASFLSPRTVRIGSMMDDKACSYTNCGAGSRFVS